MSFLYVIIYLSVDIARCNYGCLFLKFSLGRTLFCVFKYFCIYFSVWMCAHVCIAQHTYMHVHATLRKEVIEDLSGVSSFLLLCRFQRLNSGHQSWKQVLLPGEPSPQCWFVFLNAEMQGIHMRTHLWLTLAPTSSLGMSQAHLLQIPSCPLLLILKLISQ